jgi:hypothetical protein
MSNFGDINSSIALFGKTSRNGEDNSTTLTIPLEFAKELGIENSKVLMSLLYDYEGGKHLLISKFHREILID